MPEEIDVLFNMKNYPFEFINKEGNPDGFNIDLLYAIAREASLSVNLVDGNWKSYEEQLFNGLVDLTPRYLSKTETDYIINSDTLYYTYLSLIYNRESPIIESTELNEKILVLTSGDSSEKSIKELDFSTDFISTKIWSDSIKALSIGYGDYSIISSIQYNLMAVQYKETLNNLESFKQNIPFGYSAAKWNKNIINSMNNGISIVKVTGEFNRIYNKWFGTEQNLIITKTNSLNRTSIYILASVILVVILLFYIIRRKV